MTDYKMDLQLIQKTNEAINILNKLITNDGNDYIVKIDSILLKKDLDSDLNITECLFNYQEHIESIIDRLPNRLKNDFYFDGMKKAFNDGLNMIFMICCNHINWADNYYRVKSFNLYEYIIDQYYYYARMDKGIKRDRRRSIYELYNVINFLKDNSSLNKTFFKLRLDYENK